MIAQVLDIIWIDVSSLSVHFIIVFAAIGRCVAAFAICKLLVAIGTIAGLSQTT